MNAEKALAALLILNYRSKDIKRRETCVLLFYRHTHEIHLSHFITGIKVIIEDGKRKKPE